jgi:small subunit ribosomal protein S16
MLKIRLRRMGARNNPFYRVVVSDSRKVPTAASLEEIGYYDATKNPAQVSIDTERVDYWVSRGANLSPTVKNLVAQAKKSA